jgi:hypothetical protein
MRASGNVVAHSRYQARATWRMFSPRVRGCTRACAQHRLLRAAHGLHWHAHRVVGAPARIVPHAWLSLRTRF